MHVGKLDMALLEHLERQQKLLPEEIFALAVIGLGGEHAHRVLGQLVAPEVGFAAPDREQNVAGHPELPLDGGERDLMLLGEPPALLGEPRDARLLDVVGRRLHEFGLARRGSALLSGQVEVGQREVGLQRARRQIEGRARDTHFTRLRPQRRQPLREGRIGGGGRRWQREPEEAEGANDSDQWKHLSAARFGYPKPSPRIAPKIRTRLPGMLSASLAPLAGRGPHGTEEIPNSAW